MYPVNEEAETFESSYFCVENLRRVEMPKTITVSKRAPLHYGLKTPRRAFIFPILSAISRLGGSASINEVMAVVLESMRGTLNKFDYQELDHGSRRIEPRWRNTARWAKDSLVNLGLIASDSPRGVWTITDLGYSFLSETR